MKYIKNILFLCITITILSCGAYSFTGADTGSATSYQVNYFQNTATLIDPGLDLDFTRALQDLIQNQTSLDLVNSNGDLVYEGEITQYRISPTTATANSTAAQNRLTIGVKVRFYNKKEPEKDFEKSFSFFYDYTGTELLSGTTKTVAYEEIFERLTQDIFNASLANW
ncbi:LptE family protein [Olleya sp. YSTF-M6]|uniref:LptE family protein n=1 Tax=Olleya sediminilitoris TaxID=2795739 RepID=A0ABS1WJB8_9FLAO|nr:LptE family protein [Olleya sediminilitoris]MBL7559220.1 LptE family protein [Olleya sediminilitoris]